MSDESHEPQRDIGQISTLAEIDSPALATDLEDSFFETRRLRKDGWNGVKMATFCGTLAETGVVTYACRAAGMSAQSAYGLRHRNPVFAMAWKAALSMARERLADELLARSLKGGAEQLLKDGCIVAERHTFDNKLAFAMLRRLDRQAELGTTFRTPAAWETPLPAPAVRGQWQDLLDALSQERSADAMRLLDPPEVDSEVDDPPVQGVEGDELDAEELPDPRIWWDLGRKEYRTNFPPPDGQHCVEHEVFGHRDYHRSLTVGEAELMARRDSAEAAGRRAADEAERDTFFAALAVPPPSTGADTSPRNGGGVDKLDPSPSQGEVARSTGGGTRARKTTKYCPPPKPSAKGET